MFKSYHNTLPTSSDILRPKGRKLDTTYVKHSLQSVKEKQKKKGLDKKCKSKQEQLLLYPTDQHESCHSRERKSGSLEWLYVIVKRQDRIWYKLDIDSCAQIVNKVDLQHTRQNKQLMTKYMMESFMSNVHSKKVHKNPPVWRKLRQFGGHSTSLY